MWSTDFYFILPELHLDMEIGYGRCEGLDEVKVGTPHTDWTSPVPSETVGTRASRLQLVGVTNPRYIPTPQGHATS